jgi:hypothetical protein
MTLIEEKAGLESWIALGTAYLIMAAVLATTYLMAIPS